jgi:DNA-binding MarR family transcriptional regulator
MSHDVRWLSAAEQETWRAYLELTIRLDEVFDRGLRSTGLNLPYYEILVRLSEADDRRMRMSALAERSASSRSRLSHAVARLEQQGYVRREECPTDRRGQVCVLTDAGFAKLVEAAPVHVSDVREALLDGLSPAEIRTFGTLCASVLRHLDAREG